jgi:ABC-type dipeptide/oligopeptide/nickel transport system permease subunit
LVVIAALFAPLLAPHDPEMGNLRERNIPPAWSGGERAVKTVVERLTINERTTSVKLSDARKIDPNIQLGDQIGVFVRPAGSTKFLLGTDQLGRDVLSRIIFGARISLLVSIITLLVGGSIGVTMGLMAGWYGGVVDEFFMRLVDTFLAIPLILIALVLVITLGQSLNMMSSFLAGWAPHHAETIITPHTPIGRAFRPRNAAAGLTGWWSSPPVLVGGT